MRRNLRQNKIHIGKRDGRQYHVTSGATFFDGLDYCKFNFDGIRITIEKCGLYVPKNAIRVVKQYANSYRISVISDTLDLPIGDFLFDEESTQDCIVIYFGEE